MCTKLARGLNTWFLLQTDHLIGTSSNAPQRPLVTYTEMGTVGLGSHMGCCATEFSLEAANRVLSHRSQTTNSSRVSLVCSHEFLDILFTAETIQPYPSHFLLPRPPNRTLCSIKAHQRQSPNTPVWDGGTLRVPVSQ
ncbi:hypothetical protein TNCV_4966421 [Trichonephila clavipes]|nr:hypothetical protein TNCV_4966421 [Trichonephila clavipes]